MGVGWFGIGWFGKGSFGIGWFGIWLVWCLVCLVLVGLVLIVLVLDGLGSPGRSDFLSLSDSVTNTADSRESYASKNGEEFYVKKQYHFHLIFFNLGSTLGAL